MQKIKGIDGGKPFDWGKTSSDYAKFRDVYPQKFYDMIIERGLCTNGQKVLDIGSGTGVLPRNMYRYGAKWVGTDIASEQIEQAKLRGNSAAMREALKRIVAASIVAKNANAPEWILQRMADIFAMATTALAATEGGSK